MKDMIDRLRGMRRIILSGGEPMAYKHFWEVLDYVQGKFEKIVLSTNASFITRDGAARLKDLVDYIDITVDGPRRQHDLIRGNYDTVIRGLRRVAEEEIPLSVICVFLPRNHNAINCICQTCDIFTGVVQLGRRRPARRLPADGLGAGDQAGPAEHLVCTSGRS